MLCRLSLICVVAVSLIDYCRSVRMNTRCKLAAATLGGFALQFNGGEISAQASAHAAAAAQAPTTTTTSIASCGKVSNMDLTYIGSGGSGTVFKGVPKEGEAVVVKVSRKSSEPSVRKEAQLLVELNRAGVENIEQYVTSCDISVRENAQGYAAVFSPYLEGPEASSIAGIQNDPGGAVQAATARALLKTAIMMIHSNIYLTDVQILVEPGTGRMLVVDLTEAGRLHLGGASPLSPLSFQDRTAIASFLSECMQFVHEAVAKAPGAAQQQRIRDAAMQGVEDGIANAASGNGNGNGSGSGGLSTEVVALVRELTSHTL